MNVKNQLPMNPASIMERIVCLFSKDKITSIFRVRSTVWILLISLMAVLPTKAVPLNDTTLFRMKVLQDTVYAGDTVDVEFYIGDPNILGLLNILSDFEMEVATDTSLIRQDQIQFKLDSASLASFFGTLISNISIIQAIDPILGTLNVKSSNTTPGGGNARIGQGKYIVQDNAAGRQYMRFNYTKASSRTLLLSNPVKVMIDSVYIAERETPTAVNPIKAKRDLKIYPNPAGDYVEVEGEKIDQFDLYTSSGIWISTEMITNPSTQKQRISLEGIGPGMYLLVLKMDGIRYSYNIIKN